MLAASHPGDATLENSWYATRSRGSSRRSRRPTATGWPSSSVSYTSSTGGRSAPKRSGACVTGWHTATRPLSSGRQSAALSTAAAPWLDPTSSRALRRPSARSTAATSASGHDRIVWRSPPLRP